MRFLEKFSLFLGIVFLLAFGTLHVVNSRGLFFDEAIYFTAGKIIALQGGNWNFETWFVGSPWAYPAFVGNVLKYLSNEGYTGLSWTNIAVPIVREANVIFAILTLIFVYRTAWALFGHEAAAGTVAVFVTAGCIIFISGFATYDAMSLMFTAASIWLAVEATHEAIPLPIKFVLMVGSGALLGTSFVIKYITLVFVPTLLAVIFTRSMSQEDKKILTWALLTLAFAIGAFVVSYPYITSNFEALKLVFSYSGGHTATYGATTQGILYELVYFGGVVWLLAAAGLMFTENEWFTGLILLGASLTVPVYHLVFHDPLAIFKQMSWSIMLASIVAGVFVGKLGEITKYGTIALIVAMVIWGQYQVRVLEQFYPDPEPAATWLQEHVTKEDCNILVDDVWAYRWALNTTFDQNEWCVTDQWWWYNTLATPEFWVEEIEKGTFPYIVWERGAGAFNGEYTIFNYDVVYAIENSGNYVKVAEFPSYVTWGNAIMPPAFKARLEPNSIVTTEIWQRK